MTNEQAIKWLKDYIQNTPFQMEQYERAFEMAIQALSQEPCDELVSRDAVIDAIERVRNNHAYDEIEEIQKLPSVTQKPKTGHWIEHPEIETSAPEYLMFYECSECGDRQCFCKSDIHKKRFCSNCGCRMVEPQESEDKE